MSVERGRGSLDRALAALLIMAMVVGSVALWIGVPAAVLWALGLAADNPGEHLIMGLLGVPAGMALFGIVLAWLNGAYLRVTGLPLQRGEPGWSRNLQGPIGAILVVSAIVAVLALLAWMTFADVTGPVAPW